MTTRFRLEQQIAAPVAAVAATFADAGYYASLGELPKLGTPELLSREQTDDIVVIEVRYRFTGGLSAAVKAVVDPAKLTWVDRSTHDLASRQVTFELLPDHYPDRLRCRGGYSFEGNGNGTLRRAHGELSVRAALVGGLVENAIVSGLREHLEAEAAHVERYLAAS